MTNRVADNGKGAKHFKIKSSDDSQGRLHARQTPNQNINERLQSAEKKPTSDLDVIYIPDRSRIHSDHSKNNYGLLTISPRLTEGSAPMKKFISKQFQQLDTFDNNQASSFAAVLTN